MAKYSTKAVGERDSFDGHLLLIYGSQTPISTRPIVIFIHGLHGDGYKTWRPVLTSDWLQSQSGFDTGIVHHPTGYKRLRHQVTLSPADIGRSLAYEIAQLGYRRVVLVGHSMGGLVAKEVVRRLYNSHGGAASRPLRKVAGVVTVCTPTTGSGLAPALALGPASKDALALRRHSEWQRDIDEFFASNVETSLRSSGHRAIHVPVFGASSRSDAIVSGMAAELSLPGEQRAQLTGGHRSTLRMSETHDWLRTATSHLLQTTPPPRYAIAPRASDAMVTEFQGSALHPGWERAYFAALQLHSGSSILDAIDAVGPTSSRSDPDLLVRAYSATSTPHTIPQAIHDDIARQVRSGSMALGICPVGAAAEEAVSTLAAEVDAPRLRWFFGAQNDTELPDVFRQLFELTNQLILARRFSSSRRQSLIGEFHDEI